jgi:hypothetical protein
MNEITFGVPVRSGFVLLKNFGTPESARSAKMFLTEAGA